MRSWRCSSPTAGTTHQPALARLIGDALADTRAAIDELMGAFALDPATSQAAEPFATDF
jgi:hypothetical protein